MAQVLSLFMHGYLAVNPAFVDLGAAMSFRLVCVIGNALRLWKISL